MKEYIKVYNEVLPTEICTDMISLFDKSKDQQEVYDNDLMNFSQINLIKNNDTWEKYNNILKDIFKKAIDQYKYECNISDYQWPKKYGFEEFRLKRYEKMEGSFKPHVDVKDYASAKRFLAFFIYLNSGENGSDGGTEFEGINSVCQRKAGALLMFPPLWVYPHAGLISETSSKYIVGSYLHYI